MKRKVVIFPLLLAVGVALGLTACASVSSNSDLSSGVHVLSADESSITLANVFFNDDENNLRIADEHCRKFGKVAQFVGQAKDQRRYNCVRP
jgi:C4-dicarboxylate transporter